MKYKAVFTDDFLSYFRLDDNGKTLVLTDKQGHTRAVTLEVEVEPKRGRWEKHILKNANVPWGYDCSACGVWFVVGDDTVEKYYYCPNCGAKMERSEE